MLFMDKLRPVTWLVMLAFLFVVLPAHADSADTADDLNKIGNILLIAAVVVGVIGLIANSNQDKTEKKVDEGSKEVEQEAVEGQNADGEKVEEERVDEKVEE